MTLMLLYVVQTRTLDGCLPVTKPIKMTVCKGLGPSKSPGSSYLLHSLPACSRKQQLPEAAYHIGAPWLNTARGLGCILVAGPSVFFIDFFLSHHSLRSQHSPLKRVVGSNFSFVGTDSVALSVVLNRHVLLRLMLITETGWALRDWERKTKGNWAVL